MEKKLAIYKEEEVSLSPIQFLNSVLDHVAICDMDSYERKKQVSLALIATAEQMRVTNPILDIDKKEIQELILKRFKRLSINELYYAFKLERFGEYGDKTEHYNRFDVIYVAQILGKYLIWKVDVRVKNNLEIAKQPVLQEITEEQKISFVAQGILRVFNEFQEKGVVPDGNSYIYESLYDDGHLPKDVETKKMIFEEAKQVLEMFVSQEALTRKEKDEFAEIKKALLQPKSAIVVVEAKKLSVQKFFRGLLRDEEKKEKFINHYKSLIK